MEFVISPCLCGFFFFFFFTFLGPGYASGSNFNAVSPLWQSVEQIGNRADRLSIGADELFLYSNTEIEVHDSGLDSFYFFILMIILISANHVARTQIILRFM